MMDQELLPTLRKRRKELLEKIKKEPYLSRDLTELDRFISIFEQYSLAKTQEEKNKILFAS